MSFLFVFHAADTFKTMCCAGAAIVLSDRAAYLTGYVASTDTPKNTITTKKHAGTEIGVQMGQHCPQFFVT